MEADKKGTVMADVITRMALKLQSSKYQIVSSLCLKDVWQWLPYHSLYLELLVPYTGLYRKYTLTARS